MTPRRIQRRRTPGWRMPAGAVCVTRPTRWGNPFRAGDPLTDPWRQLDPPLGGPIVRDAEHAVALYRLHLQHTVGLAAAARVALAGRDLACWCVPGQPCHADVLLQLANSSDAATQESR